MTAKTTRLPAGQHPKLVSALFLTAAAILAHHTCLQAVFYMDDQWGVLDSPAVLEGQWQDTGFRRLSYLSYMLTYQFFGASPVAFHAGNLLIHLVSVLGVYVGGLTLLRLHQERLPSSDSKSRISPELIAFLAALLFAVHPLTTEVTHYTRARDHGLVGLFSFATAVATALVLRRGWRWLPLWAVAVLGATFSKEQGLPNALAFAVITALFFGRKTDWRRLVPNRWWIIGLGLALILLLAWNIDQFEFWKVQITRNLNDSRLGWHVLTQSRVFWAYVGRMVVPIHLCSDHLVAWTKSTGDLAAWFALVAIILSAAASGVLWIRKYRLAAFLLIMTALPLLMRFAYVVSELMVEYRVYPSMPWFCLGAACLLARFLHQQPAVLRRTTVVLALVLAAVSIKRGLVWRSTESLADDILQKYPRQLRAELELAAMNLRASRPEAVLERRPSFNKRLTEIVTENRDNPNRYYEHWMLWAVLGDCLAAEAYLETRGPGVAIGMLERTRQDMRETSVEFPVLLGFWHFTMGKAQAAQGNTEAALEHWERAQMGPIPPIEFERAKERWMPGAQP